MRAELERRCVSLILPVVAAYVPGLLLCMLALRKALHLLPPELVAPATVLILMMLWGWMQLCSRLLPPERPQPVRNVRLAPIPVRRF
ncbi:MAG TPA: hypothetical protein VHE37_03490 [Nevskiaceae bacterium]|nr:hypothetical protein [Nevskiaceae bacterium]